MRTALAVSFDGAQEWGEPGNWRDITVSEGNEKAKGVIELTVLASQNTAQEMADFCHMACVTEVTKFNGQDGDWIACDFREDFSPDGSLFQILACFMPVTVP